MEATTTSAEPAPPAEAASAAVISAVFGSGDLLREILLRLESPTYLVCAAAVSKRWLRHASDPSFLSRFRGHHPPRLLGFYVSASTYPRVRFVPLSKHPELAAVVPGGSFEDLPDDAIDVWDCRIARILVYDDSDFIVCSPLHPDPDQATTILPRPPIQEAGNRDLIQKSLDLRFPEDCGDGLLCTMVMFRCTDRRASVHLSDLQDGAWGEVRDSDIIELPEQVKDWNRWGNHILLARGKIYMMCMAGYILGVDSSSVSLFCIKLPNGVRNGPNLGLSCADGSRLCLVNVSEYKVHVWHHNVGCESTGNWKLIDTVCLRQAFGHLADPTWYSQDDIVRVDVVGDNDDFVFLRIDHKVFCMCISSKTVEKVFHPTNEYEYLHGVYPFTMFWPPTFPVLNGGHDHDE